MEYRLEYDDHSDPFFRKMPSLKMEYRLVNTDHSDHFLQLAFWSGTVTLTLTLALLLNVIWLRLTKIRETNASRKFLTVWQPLVIHHIAGEKVSLPQISQADIPNFLHLWVHYHESLRGEPIHALNEMFDMLGIRPALREILRTGDTENRLLAIMALGHLRDTAVWDQLIVLARAPKPVISIMAARALVSIDANKAASIVIPLLIRRRDWSPPKIAIMLKESEIDFIQAFLARVSSSARKQQPYLPRLLRLVESLHMNRPLPFVRTLITQSDNAELVSACIRLVCDPSELDFVRPKLKDSHWSVRLQAVAVVGKFGSSEDVESLKLMLTDPEWWVRYRAAQALASLPFVNRRQLHELEATLSDRYARDILQQVIAETEPT